MLSHERYGLRSGNPFVRRELDPLKRAEDADLIINVDGFRSLTQFEYDLQEAVNRQESCFFLVTGESGCGRSSVANYLLDRYRELRKIGRRNFVVVPDPERRVDSEDRLSVFQNWALNLMNEIETESLMSPNSCDAIRQKIQQIDRPELFAAAVKPLLRQVVTALSGRAEKGGIGVCLEGLRNPDLASEAVKVFSRIETVVILTALDTQETREELIRRCAGEQVFRHIELSSLDWQEVQELVSSIWMKNSSRDLPFPFSAPPPPAVRRLRPLGRTLVLFRDLLDLKLKQPDQNDPPYGSDEFYFMLDVLEGRRAKP